MHTQHGSLTTLTPPPPGRATFERQFAEGFQTPGLHRFLSTGREDLYPHFARYHEYLRRLPRRARRALQRQWKRSLSAIALLLALGQLPALAATITVTGGCTLVDAITAANTDAAQGGCLAGSGADVIALTADVELTAVDNSTDGPNGLPSVTGPLTINGNNQTLQRSTVSGTPEFRLLHVAESGDLTLNGITLSNGQGSSAGYANGNGGAVLNRGTLAINTSVVSGNSSYGLGGAVYNAHRYISYNSFIRSTLSVTNSTISDNLAFAASGGGIENRGTATIVNSTIENSSASS